jgi:glycosyltransferase involved in cell wall biosynthesis
MSNPKIAWLLTSAFDYWQPMLSHLTHHFPQMTAFTAKWKGYARGFENSFAVEAVGKRHIFQLKKSHTGYGNSFTYLSPQIIQRLLNFKPDLIFTNAFGVWTLFALLLKAVGNWRVVIAYEGSSPSVDFQHSPLRLIARRFMVRCADAYISNSHAGKDYLIKTLRAPEDHVFVHPYEVPSVISLAQSSPSSSQLAETLDSLLHPIFLFVGQIIPRKGLKELLVACQELKQTLGYRNFTLLIVGEGAQKQELQSLSLAYDLADQVHWIGKVEYDQLGTYFQKADVMILPTLEDTWGVVVLEAMAMGKPMLCSTNAGAVELIKDGENGYRFDPNDSEQLAKLMAKFIDQPQLIQTMGQESLKCMERYTPSAAADFLKQVAHFVLKE